MRRLQIIAIGLVLLQACRPAAAPVSVSNTPVSVNGVAVNRSDSQPTKPIAEMSWTDRQNGSVQKVKDLKGKVVILDFWATYCPPCIEEIPHLMELQAKYGPDQVQVIGLHVGGEEDQPKIPEFVERLKITYPLGFPEDSLTAFVFGSDTAIPQTAVFDRNGKLVQRITGFSPDIKRDLDSAVAAAVARNE